MDSKNSSVFFVISHLQNDLSPYLDKPNITPINLDLLDIAKPFKSQLLAESRFFLSSHIGNVTEKYIGIGSPRWEERFPTWPSIEETNKLSVNLKPSEFYSPQNLYSKNYNVKNWIKAQDLVHPGISKILNPIWQQINQKERTSDCWIPMGNSFVFHKMDFAEIIETWRDIFFTFQLNDLENLPFTYRCVKCASVSSEGLGRWKSNRHASYFLERVMALIVASKPNLTAIRLDKFGNRKKRSIMSTTFGLPITAQIYSLIAPAINSKTSCDHLHFGPGKN
jgi:hypothetical protein